MDADHTQAARADGFRAGRMLLSCEANPYRDDDPLRAEWHREWFNATSEAMCAAFKRRQA